MELRSLHLFLLPENRWLQRFVKKNDDASEVRSQLLVVTFGGKQKKASKEMRNKRMSFFSLLKS